LKECSEEYSAMANDLDHSKQTLTACNNLLELADVIREKAKQHSELSLQLSEVEKDVIKYKNAKRTLDSYNEDIDRYQRLIDKNKFRNKQIHLQISQLALNVPEDLEERLDALANERKEIESQQEKRYLYSTAQNELHEIDSSYSQKISGAVNRRDHRQKRISEIRQQEEFMKNSGCPDIESASCRFLSKAVEDVKSLPVELDNLKKCEEEIEILTSERNQKIADKQEKIKNIEYDPKRLAILTASVTELPSLLNTFASIEPLLEDIDENISALKYLNWIIIGAETGHRKEKVIPEFEWIKRIVVEADYNGIPVFMKDSLIPIVGEKNMRRDYPKELQIRKRSEKVNKKLSGNCMLCGKTEDKNKMVTLTARAVRGGKATSFGHMCHSCFAKWLTSHNIPVPDLENKKEIEDGKEKL